MKLDYKGLKDCHLNVFYGYAGEHLENNITKAFINTFDSFDESTKKRDMRAIAFRKVTSNRN